MRRIAAAGGIAFVALQLAAQGLIQVGGTEPAFGASAEETLRFFEARNPALFAVGSYLSLFSFLAFLWFLGALWASLRRAEGEGAWRSVVVVASGVLFLASLTGGWELAVFRVEEGLDPQFARLAFDMGNLGFANSWIPLASMVLAASAVSLPTAVFPRWIGWLGIAVAVGLLVSRGVWTTPVAFAPYVLFWVWIVAVSVVLLRGVPGDRIPVPGPSGP